MLLDADDFTTFNINTKLDIAITQVYNMRTAVDQNCLYHKYTGMNTKFIL